MRVVARLRPGPRWLADTAVQGQGAPIVAHLDFMRDRFDDTSLLVGGPLRGGMSGFALLEVPDLAAARDFAQADPAVSAGVLVYEVDELVPYFDALSGVRRSGAVTRPSRRLPGMRP